MLILACLKETIQYICFRVKSTLLILIVTRSV